MPRLPPAPAARRAPLRWGPAGLLAAACACAAVARERPPAARRDSPARCVGAAADAPPSAPCAPHGSPAARVAAAGAVRLSGRFAEVPGRPDCMRFAYGQSAVEVRFLGPTPRLLLARGDGHRGPILFDVQLDGQPLAVRRLDPQGDSEAPVGPSGGRPAGGTDSDRAPGAPHSLRLVRRSEALMGEAWACGVALPAGTTLLPPAAPPARRLLFVGDSITAGYGNLGVGPHCPFTPEQENGSLAFAPLAAAALGADLEVVAWSGRGLWRNLDGSRVGTVPQLLGRALPEDPRAGWSAAAAPVDAVVVNLGTNDFSGGPVDLEAFTTAYVDLLAELRRLYPAAHLVAALGPMLQDAAPTPGALGHARASLREAVSRRRRAGEPAGALSTLEFPRQDGSLGYGCDWHPSLATHRAMAAQLVAHLRAAGLRGCP